MTASPTGFVCPPDLWARHLAEQGISERELTPENRADLQVCAGCLADMPAAWEAFHAQFAPFLRMTAGRLAGNVAEAEDLVSRIFLDLVEKRKLGQYTGRGSFRGWLRAMVAHRFLDDRRSAARVRMESVDEMINPPVADCGEESCERFYRRPLLEEMAGLLRSLLESLPVRKAGFLNLYYFQEATLAEAAQLLDMHESTASRWNAGILEGIRKDILRFLQVKKGWKPAEVSDFLDRCLGYLAERLSALRNALPGGKKTQAGSGSDVMESGRPPGGRRNGP